MAVLAEAQDRVPSRMDGVYLVERDIVKPHGLLPLDNASNVVNEEN